MLKFFGDLQYKKLEYIYVLRKFTTNISLLQLICRVIEVYLIRDIARCLLQHLRYLSGSIVVITLHQLFIDFSRYYFSSSEGCYKRSMDCKFLRQCLQQTYKLQPFITGCHNIYMDRDKKPKLVNTACFGRRDMSNMLPLYRMSIICCLMCYQTRKLLSVEIFIDRNLYS